jgi:hypothetical protein
LLASIANAQSFFRYVTSRKNLNPPYPPFPKGGDLIGIPYKSPPLKKGDLGGFKKQQNGKNFWQMVKYDPG